MYVHPAHRRHGIARGLYLALFDVLAAQGYVNAYAGITLPNSASVALHESVGFRPLGVYVRVGFKHGAWHDVGWWTRALRPHDAEPAEPLPLGDLMAPASSTPGWRMASARLGPTEQSGRPAPAVGLWVSDGAGTMECTRCQ